MKSERPLTGRLSFEDWMSVLGVVVTLLAAGWAVRQTLVSRWGGDAGRRAERLGAQAFQVRAIETEAAQLQYSRFQLWDNEQRQLGNAWQRYRLGDRRALGELRRWQAVTAATWADTRALADQQAEARRLVAFLESDPVALARPVCPITPLGWRRAPGCPAGHGPAEDQSFPRRYFAAATWNANRLIALRDDARDQSTALGRQTTANTIALSVFGVALFLLGFSQSPQAKNRRRVFLTTALCLVGAGVVYSAYVTKLSLGRPAELTPGRATAAKLYADGVSRREAGDRRAAREAFDGALARWPGFARARYQRSLVTADASTAIADLEFADEHDLRLAEVASELARRLTERAVASGDRGDLDAAEAAARRAEASEPADPAPRMSRALARLVDGDLDAALGAYREGRDKALAEGDGTATERSLARALTDVRRAAGQWRLATGDVHRVHEVLMSDTPRRRVTAAGALQVKVTSGWVAWELPVKPALKRGKDRLVVQWYHRSGPQEPWSVLPELSGRVAVSPSGEPRPSRQRPYVGATARASSAACLQPGDYELDVYVNGRLLAHRATVLEGQALRPRINREMNLAICVPDRWTRATELQRAPFSIAEFPALACAWTSPDRSEGVLLLRFNGQFTTRSAGGEETERQTAAVATRAIRFWRAAFPSSPRAEGGWSPGALKLIFSLSPGIVQTFHYGPGDAGLVRVQAAFNRNDVAVVVATFGPRANARARRAIDASVADAFL